MRATKGYKVRQLIGVGGREVGSNPATFILSCHDVDRLVTPAAICEPIHTENIELTGTHLRTFSTQLMKEMSAL